MKEWRVDGQEHLSLKNQQHIFCFVIPKSKFRNLQYKQWLLFDCTPSAIEMPPSGEFQMYNVDSMIAWVNTRYISDNSKMNKAIIFLVLSLCFAGSFAQQTYNFSGQFDNTTLATPAPLTITGSINVTATVNADFTLTVNSSVSLLNPQNFTIAYIQIHSPALVNIVSSALFSLNVDNGVVGNLTFALNDTQTLDSDEAPIFQDYAKLCNSTFTFYAAVYTKASGPNNDIARAQLYLAGMEPTPTPTTSTTGNSTTTATTGATTTGVSTDNSTTTGATTGATTTGVATDNSTTTATTTATTTGVATDNSTTTGLSTTTGVVTDNSTTTGVTTDTTTGVTTDTTTTGTPTSGATTGVTTATTTGVTTTTATTTVKPTIKPTPTPSDSGSSVVSASLTFVAAAIFASLF
eukprot:gene1482-1720_t